jgi:hypothetical protein
MKHQPKGKRPLEKTKNELKDNIKVDLSGFLILHLRNGNDIK